MVMRVGLIQVDGKLPNLALMKLSSWHKNLGDERTIIKPSTISSLLVKFDKVYISSIFLENKDFTINLVRQFKNIDVEVGGTYFPKTLPYEVEHTMPDYELFDCDYSIGFTTRGCIRKCPFCVVWRKEGYIRENCDIYEFWNSEHKHLILFDNNILALPDHFKRVSEQIIRENLTVDFNQGLDIRLINDENAEILAQLRVRPELRFAFDDVKTEKQVIEGLETLKRHGIKKRIFFYVLVGFNSTIEEDLYRLNLLRKLNQIPYVMRYRTCRSKKKYNDLAAWANMQRFFRAMTFERFQECRDNPKLVRLYKKERDNNIND